MKKIVITAVALIVMTLIFKYSLTTNNVTSAPKVLLQTKTIAQN